MTRFKESAQRTVSAFKRQRNGWVVTFVDGSCRLINKTDKKGTTPIIPGMIIKSCRSHCKGADEFGNCTLRPRGPRANNVPQIKCHEQFVYAYRPYNFGTEKPKFERSVQKMSQRIKTYKTIKPTKQQPVERLAITFEDGSITTVLKSSILGHAKIQHGHHLVPCGEECLQRAGVCPHCHGARRGTTCEQQFLFCRKFLSRHKNDKQR